MRKSLIACLVASSALTAPGAVQAQAQPQARLDEITALRAQVAALQAQLDALTARIDGAQQQAQPAVAPPATPPPSPAPAIQENPVTTTFAGAPEIEAEGGWSFKPFGRLNIDAGSVALPDALGRSEGLASEFRRARLGMEGDIPGGFGYKFEVDFADGGAELTEVFLTYTDDGLTVTAGQHNNFQGLEELTSSRWSSFIERAAFTDAFGFQRRLGLSAQYASGPVLVQAGVFSDNVDDLPNDNWSADGRVVFAPRAGSTQLHFGGSLHLTQLEAGSTVRYRQRPMVHFTSERPIATPNIAADSELGAGLEAAVIAGRFHAAAEGFWQTARTPGPAANAGFFGGYVEAGYFLTGDKRGYRGGRWERTRPASGIDEGGSGAWEINLRYDYLDLNDGAVRGGIQNAYQASLVWVPTDYTRLSLSYGHMTYDDAVLPLPGGDRSWSADVLGMRSQIDF